LRTNYSALGQWPLAISAYNHGLAGMKRAKSQCGGEIATVITCYRSASFGYASMNFYAEFVAALELLQQHRGPLAVSVAAARGASSSASAQEYLVRKGDTLLLLSRKFSTTPQEIMALNGIDNANRLLAGRIILIPKGS
jgi:hypothetical protein